MRLVAGDADLQSRIFDAAQAIQRIGIAVFGPDGRTCCRRVDSEDGPRGAVVVSAFDERTDQAHRRERSDTDAACVCCPHACFVDECLAHIKDDHPHVMEDFRRAHRVPASGR